MPVKYMKSLKMTFVVVVMIFVMNFVVPEIMSTMDVGYQSYGSYLQWFTLLGLFYVILPDKQPSIFT